MTEKIDYYNDWMAMQKFLNEHIVRLATLHQQLKETGEASIVLETENEQLRLKLKFSQQENARREAEWEEFKEITQESQHQRQLAMTEAHDLLTTVRASHDWTVQRNQWLAKWYGEEGDE